MRIGWMQRSRCETKGGLLSNSKPDESSLKRALVIAKTGLEAWEKVSGAEGIGIDVATRGEDAWEIERGAQSRTSPHGRPKPLYAAQMIFAAYSARP